MARSAPAHKQKCAYCGAKFVPTKRGTQRFCGASCRVSYCRKKKAGTLGQLTPLPGPPRRAAGLTFQQTVLATGLGSLGANVVTQAWEYALVTRELVQQVRALQHAVAALGSPLPAGPAVLPASPTAAAVPAVGAAAPQPAVLRDRLAPGSAPRDEQQPASLAASAAALAAFDQALQLGLAAELALPPLEIALTLA